MARRPFDPFHEMRGALSAAAVGAAMALGAGLAPEAWHYFDLLSHFRVHLAVALLLAGVGFVLFAARRRAVGCFLIGAAGLASLYGPLYSEAAAVHPGNADIKLLSFNMLYVNERPEDVAALLEQEKPDIAFILEAPMLYPHLDRLAETFPYQSGCDMERWCDLLVLSRTPFEYLRRPGTGRIWDRVVATRVIVDGRSVNMVALHLSKPYEDGAQWHELRIVRSYLASLVGPVVLAGDFNATPWSNGLQSFARETGLSFVAGYRPSWPARYGLLGFPIDHVMVRDVVPTQVRQLDETYGSNHLGLTATFDLPD